MAQRKCLRGGIGLSDRHKLLPGEHTNLDGQALGGVPPCHSLLREGCALTEGLSAVELPREEQQMELEMTDRKGYGLKWECFLSPWKIKMTADCDG